tara:strand:- start:798 stop:1208 length:411 start_codon:yes stop_codon:yes gene_type:complete
MTWALKRFSLTENVPLAISRGTTSAVVRLELSVERDGFYGTETVEQELRDALPRLNRLDSLLPQRMDPLLQMLSPPAVLFPLPPLKDLLDCTEALANLARPFNSGPSARVQESLNLPCTDPIRWSAEPLLEAVRRS